MTGLQDDEIRAVATVNRDPIAVVCAELMRRGRMPSVSELMLGTATWTWGFRCSMDWSKGKSTGNHGFSHEDHGAFKNFP